MDRRDDVVDILRRIRILRLLRQRQRQQETAETHSRLWVRPVLAAREELGEYHHLVQQLRQDPEGHHRYFRMYPDDFDVLLDLVKGDVEKETTNMRRPIPPGERLAVTLRFLSFFGR